MKEALRDLTVNARLRAVMERKRMKQTALSRAAGIRYQSLHRAVNGRRPIYADELLPLCRALGVGPEALLGAVEDG